MWHPLSRRGPLRRRADGDTRSGLASARTSWGILIRQLQKLIIIMHGPKVRRRKYKITLSMKQSAFMRDPRGRDRYVRLDRNRGVLRVNLIFTATGPLRTVFGLHLGRRNNVAAPPLSDSRHPVTHAILG